MGHHRAHQPRIAPLERVVERIEPAKQQVPLGRGNWRTQPQRALRRLERGGVDRAQEGGCGDHKRELREHLAGEAGDEGSGQEHRHQHERDADHRPGDLVHGLDRRFARRQMVCVDMVGRVLDDDDGVVDNDADRQHQTEERE